MFNLCPQRLVRIGCVVFAFSLPGPSSGAVLTWDGSTGNWDTDASWLVSGTEPTAADDATINSGTVTVNLIGEVVDDLFVADTGTAELELLSGGTLDSKASRLGAQAGSNGTATVTGAGSTWINSLFLYVGNSGTGTLNVEAGGTVMNTTGYIGVNSVSTGTATITGAGSTWTNSGELRVGRVGTGTLNVEAGGTVSNTLGYIGSFLGSTGSATVTGPGSTWTNSGNLSVGTTGDGTLIVEDGGTVSSTAGFIGSNPGSTGSVTVTGQDSAWANSSALFVGHSGTGTLNVQAGGTLSSNSAFIGLVANSTGTATVTGPGSTWTNSDDLFIGGNSIGPGGSGSLQILNAGEVEVVGTLKILNTGSTLIDGGILSVGSIDTTSFANLDFVAGTFNLTSDNLTVGAGGLFGDELFVQNNQTVNITNLATVEADGALAVFGGFSSGGLTNLGTAIFFDTTIGGPVTNPTGSNIDVIGNVTFTGMFSGGGGIFGSGTANFQGGFSPGDSPALVTVEGSAKLDASNSLFMEIGGLLAGSEFDVVGIADSLTAGGTLDITLINAFAPNAGDVFDILDFGSITGSFNGINLPPLAGNLDWNTSNLLIDGTLSVFSTALQGDLDNDGFVGINDLNIVLANWNQNVPPADPLADPSGDGFIGIDDINFVLGNWNTGTPPQLPGANIPEPATLGTLGMLGMLTMRSRRITRTA